MGITLISIGRFLCGLIDSIIYRVISIIYNLFYDVANVILYSEEAVDAIGQRIALILGIFMLFRVAVSLISYLISPDKLSDKSKGGTKLITNIIVSLVLLSTINIIFVEAYKIQIKIVDSKIVEKIFFGKKATVENADISYILYSSFISPTGVGIQCENYFDPYVDSPECSKALSTIIKNQDVINVINDDVLKYHKIDSLLSNYDALNYRNAGVYVFDYLPIISTVSGIITVLMLISFCMDLALRAVKLFFLQIIAPIPIIANIDPQKGSDVFKKWVKETINTYLTIFIRIIAINLAIFMITLVKNEFYELFKGKSTFLTVLLVIGCLMFAKQVPKLLESIFGIKDSMSLKPLKKLKEETLGGKQLTGIGAGAIAGTASGLWAAGSNVIAPGSGGRVLGAGAGFASAFGTSIKGGLKGEKIGKNISNAYDTAMLNKQAREDRLDDDVSWLEMKKSRAQQRMGMHLKDDSVKSEKKHISKIQDAYKIIQNQSAAMDTTNFNVSDHNSEYKGNNQEILKFRTMNFAGIKELAKFKEQADSTKLQQRFNETAAEFIQRQKDHQDYLKYIEGTIDSRNNALADGSATTGDIATDHAIQDAFRTMKDEAKAFNDSIDSIDPNVGHITIADAKMINGTSKGADARLSVSKVSQHAEKVQQYGAKKNQK